MAESSANNMVTPNQHRLYKVWPGRNKFFCGGRLIFGPDVASLFLSMLLIAGPALAFCVQVIFKIIRHTKNDTDENHIFGVPTLCVALFLTIMDMIFLFLTSSRDPGIIPRNPRPLEADEQFDATTPSMEWINGAAPHIRIPRIKEAKINGVTIKIKYCDTCLLYRPPRASHCSVCNNCVQKFDHHCPWVGQCIGQRNYRFFFMFISSATVLCIYIFTFSWLNVVEEKRYYNNSIMKTLTGEILSLVLITYTFVAVWFVGGLTILHLYLISTNQTTYENFRYRYDKKANPFNKGLWGNFKHVFFSKMAPSMIDFRSWTTEDKVEDEPITPTSEMSIFFPHESRDIEMGGRPELDDLSMPSILRNLDYSIVDDAVPFSFPVLQEHTVDGLGDSMEHWIVGDARVLAENADERNNSNGTTPDPTQIS